MYFLFIHKKQDFIEKEQIPISGQDIHWKKPLKHLHQEETPTRAEQNTQLTNSNRPSKLIAKNELLFIIKENNPIGLPKVKY